MNKADLIKQVNLERLQDGLVPLRVNRFLEEAAQLKTNSMKEEDYFAHVSPLSKSIVDFIPENYAYYAIGENLAFGFNNEKVLVDSWLNSREHRANVLYDLYRDTGISVTPYKDSYLVAHIFGIEQQNYFQERYPMNSKDNKEATTYIEFTLILSVIVFIVASTRLILSWARP